MFKFLEAKAEGVFMLIVMGIFTALVGLIWLLKVGYYLLLGLQKWIETLPGIDIISGIFGG